MQDVSIIIRTRNEATLLEKTLKKIVNQDTNFNYEIIIVDSYSTDNTRYVAKKYGCKIVNLSPINFSWGRGINFGMENSNAEYCILLSAHSYPVDNTWMDKLVRPLLEDKNLAATYGGQIPIKGIDPFEEVELKKWFPKSNKKIAVSNSNACIRRSVWQKIKFNEVLSSYEDVEWANRVRNMGYILKYIPEAAVYHSHTINIKLIYKRWYWRSRMALYVRQKEKKISFLKKFPPKILSMTLALGLYTTLLFEDFIHCFKEGYLSELWKAPIYEIVRCTAFCRGVFDALVDLKKETYIEKYMYNKESIPKFLEKFKVIE